MAAPTFSLVLPFFNPGEVLLRSWREVYPFIEAHPDWEFLFVSDGSTDGSDAKLATITSQLSNVKLLRYPRNRGKGFAVRLGLRRAVGRYRIFTDIDLAYPLEMIEGVADQLAAGNHCVIASRAHPESIIEAEDHLKGYVRRRKSQSTLFSLAARMLVGIPQRDPQAGLKGFSDRAANLLLSYAKCPGFGLDCELLTACRYFGIKVREMPIHVRYNHEHTTTSLKTSFKMLGELWSIRRRWRKLAKNGLPMSVLDATDPAVCQPAAVTQHPSHED